MSMYSTLRSFFQSKNYVQKINPQHAFKELTSEELSTNEELTPSPVRRSTPSQVFTVTGSGINGRITGIVNLRYSTQYTYLLII